MEPNLPHKREVLIPTFQRLSEQIGKERVIWRYDPIFLSDRYTVEYHIKAFEEIAASLAGYTDKVVISFMDFYKKTMRNTRTLAIQQMTAQKTRTLAEKMAEIALRYSLDIETCIRESLVVVWRVLKWEHTTRVSMVVNIAMPISMKQR